PHPELDEDVIAIEPDAGDGADLHAGDPHLVGLLQVRRFGEVSAVDLAATVEERQVLGLEGEDAEQRQEGDTGQPDRDGVALAEGLHPLHTPSLFWSAGLRT